MKELVKGSG